MLMGMDINVHNVTNESDQLSVSLRCHGTLLCFGFSNSYLSKTWPPSQQGDFLKIVRKIRNSL